MFPFQSDPGSAAVLRDELNPGIFKRFLDLHQCVQPDTDNLTALRFHVPNRVDADQGAFRQLRLLHLKQHPCSSDLCANQTHVVIIHKLIVDTNKTSFIVSIPKFKMLTHKIGLDMSNSTDQTTPVSEWENNAAKGYALCAEHTFRDHIERTQALRDRQAAYLESLPRNPPEAILAAIELMHPNGDSYPDGIEEALHLSCALEALVKDGDLAAECRTRDAALYVADRVAFAVHRATRQLDRIAHILRNPGRIERDDRSR